jgi:hypothetical protein
MTEFPPRVENEQFSVSVIVYNAIDPTYCEIGFYNYDLKTWSHFGENCIGLICWCFLPNPEAFLDQNKHLIPVFPEGYHVSELDVIRMRC